MVYQNTPVSDSYQIVQQIANFASTVGWIINQNIDDVDGNRVVTLSANGHNGYITLVGQPQGNVIINGHRNFDSNKRWFDQPDQYLAYDGDGNSSNDAAEIATRVVCEIRINPIVSVHLFGSMSPSPHLYAAIEKEPGYFRHIAIGHMEKFGSSLGGMFWDVSARTRIQSYQTFWENHRAPFLNNTNAAQYDRAYVGGFDTQTPDGVPTFNRMSDTVSSPYSWGGHNATELDSVLVASPIAFNSRTPLQSPFVMANGYTPFGVPPNIRYVDLTFFEAGDELNIGTDTWKVFPWSRRTQGLRSGNDNNYTGPEYEASGMCGIAYLKG